jgi:DNA-directed RNA polymerase
MVAPSSVEFPDVPEIDEALKGTEEWTKTWREYFRDYEQRKELHDKLQGNLYEGTRALAVARMFEKYGAIYFPWKLDFRGRAYPMPQGLNPQGSKVSQGLLELAVGKPVGQRGAYWLMVHAANCYGFDKASFDERAQWANDNTGMMLKVAKDPIGTTSYWGKAEKPYQFLACCLEWPGLLRDGIAHVSHIYVQKDGSCNGLQHLSAISRDVSTAKLVNLMPGDVPSDVYQVVADAVVAELKGMDDPMAKAWLDFGITRKIAKRPVMTLPYGSTYYAVGDFIMEAVTEKVGASMEHPFPGTLHEAVVWLKPFMWDAIKKAIPGARLTMDWLQGSVGEASKANLPVSWHTPDGFHVIQAYKDVTTKQVSLRVSGGRVSIATEVPTDKILPSKQKSAIAPNFVHSLDGCHMRMYVNKANAAGITAHVMIHDSYGTHAADVDMMDLLIREAFVEMYSQDVTKPLLDSLAAQGTPYDDPLTVGNFDINQVMDSPYFFG